jgi:hypothetical protein
LQLKNLYCLKPLPGERLVKTQQAVKRLSKFCGGFLIVDISGGSVIACSYESRVFVFNKYIHQSSPHL